MLSPRWFVRSTAVRMLSASVGLCKAIVREVMLIWGQLGQGARGGRWVRVLTTFDRVLQRARSAHDDGPIEALMLVAGHCWACSCPNLTYLCVNALRMPIRTPSWTARCGGRRERNGAQKRRKSARGHSGRPLNALLLAERANARGGASIFRCTAMAKLSIKDADYRSLFCSIKKG